MNASYLKLAGVAGGEQVVQNTDIQQFIGKFEGEVLRPDDTGYDEARTVWNGMVDKHPGLIARCTGTQDVVACVNFARDHEVMVSVRGGRTQLRGEGCV